MTNATPTNDQAAWDQAIERSLDRAALEAGNHILQREVEQHVKAAAFCLAQHFEDHEVDETFGAVMVRRLNDVAALAQLMAAKLDQRLEV